MQKFSELSLPAPLQKGLSEMGFETPTPIQAQAIPLALQGADIMGCAQTGTGKTAAFMLPMITALLNNNEVNGLVLVPTRELALQVFGVVQSMLKYLPQIKSVCLMGGAGMVPQIRALRNRPRLIVATPGRLYDHIGRQTVLLSKTRFLVLDEADRMLDFGFAPQIQAIAEHLPEPRQTLMFSATLSKDINKMAQKYLVEPQRIQVGQSANEVASSVKQNIREVDPIKKNDVLIEEVKARPTGSMIIFAATQKRADRISYMLRDAGFDADSLHGGKLQRQRSKIIRSFKEGQFRILVATDIAARGLDVDHIENVINFDLPMQPEDYIHRIGRTGRAGRSGEALSLISPEDRMQWRRISRLLGQESGLAGGDEPRRGGGGSRGRGRPGGGRGFGGGRSGGGGFGGGRSGGRGPRRDGGGSGEFRGSREGGSGEFRGSREGASSAGPRSAGRSDSRGPRSEGGARSSDGGARSGGGAPRSGGGGRFGRGRSSSGGSGFRDGGGRARSPRN